MLLRAHPTGSKSACDSSLWIRASSSPPPACFSPENPSFTWTRVLVYNRCSVHGRYHCPERRALRAPFYS